MSGMKIKEILGSQLKPEARWIVTGAAGFIGSHIAEVLLELDQKVTGIDNFSTGKKENIEYLDSCDKNNLFEFHEVDICDEPKLVDIFKGASYLIHQAALGSVPRSIQEPMLTHASNVTGFLSVLNAARKAGIKRVVYASSSSVYGDSEELPKVEERVGHVLSPYAASKMCNEVYADAYSASYGIQAVGLRYFNVFGPRQDPEGPYAAVIPRWLESLRVGVPCVIYGDGETSRDFCFVLNVVLANLTAALTEKLPSSHSVFNVACGERTTLKELYEIIAKEVCKITGRSRISDPVFEQFRQGDIRHSHADIAKISNTLNYKPLFLIHEGLAQTVAKYLNA
ncbi:MAG TPA: SDR family oxidoreductase [Oligoflexia bacterium]|nr:SDR family oxidoreductase [Oligoflexia bacterium]HMP47608.1 SDR family oxidoreductase [Oligoflexia bacterium]